jgi:hypothetical protein
MPTENQIAVLELRKKEARDSMESAFKALVILSTKKKDGFVSTTEISCSLFPQCTYENPISNGGKSYPQNSMASTVMSWLKRLVAEGKVETKLRYGRRVYKPIQSSTTSKKSLNIFKVSQ